MQRQPAAEWRLLSDQHVHERISLLCAQPPRIPPGNQPELFNACFRQDQVAQRAGTLQLPLDLDRGVVRREFDARPRARTLWPARQIVRANHVPLDSRIPT
jgi:hypothetical protein